MTTSPYATALRRAFELALAYLDVVDEAPVGNLIAGSELRARLDGPLPETGIEAAEAIEQLAARVDGGLTSSVGPRFFGWVMGGHLPAALAADEGAIDGLYDDPSNFCTSGVGHLVHRADKWPSFLTAAVRENAQWKKLLAQSAITTYLPRATAFGGPFEDIKAAAVGLAQKAIAKSKQKTDYDKLGPAVAAAVDIQANTAVDAEATALANRCDASR